jgi:uncharacterized protein YbjQ (UPF0145 family)
MGSNVITTTTNSIENAEVEKYIDLISTNVVIGTNVFSDFGASLTDLFGGFSDSYQNKLQKIYTMAIDNLKLKASRLGANAILGLKIDFDEISGKGKSMFMISAIGTAVVIKFKKENSVTSIENSITIVSNEKLEKELARRSILSNLQSNILPSEEDWIYLFNNPIEEISGVILNKYLSLIGTTNFDLSQRGELMLSNTPNYFMTINNDLAIDELYSNIVEKPQPVIEIIKKCKYFSTKKIIELIEIDHISIAVDCLSADKEYYSKSDLDQMQEIINLIDNLPHKGKIDMVKGILGKSKEKYICPKGHSNDVETEFCAATSNYNSVECNLNIKGLTQVEVKHIENFRKKVNSLQSIFEDE